MEGLLKNDTNIHAGIRTTLSGPSDYDNDGYCGFEIVEAREIDTIGMDGIIKKIRDRVGTKNPVYLSLDIDTLDPACESDLVVFEPLEEDVGVNLTNYSQLPLPPVPLRREAGLRESYARSSEGWMVSTSLLLMLSKLP